MDGKIKYLAAITVLSLMSILLATGFVDELSKEKNDVETNQFESPTNSTVCDDNLCIEGEEKIIMPSSENSEEINDIQIEEETINPIDTNEKTLGSVLPSTKANVPVTIPLHQGYYKGTPVYYIITDSSDSAHADLITKNQGWKVNLAPLLANATKDSLSKTYMFTNGRAGDGVHGFQGEIFTSTPAQVDEYSALTSHVHVTWDDASVPFILDSEKAVMDAEDLGLIVLTELNLVSNMPQTVWWEGQMPVKVNKILTNETPFGGGQILDIDLTDMTVTFIAHRSWDFEGKPIYFIVTDATPINSANSLGVTYVPKNAALISNPAAVDMFHFMNGISGSGPMGFQAGITSWSTGDANYSPMSKFYFIEWNDVNSTAQIHTKYAIEAFEEKNLIQIHLARPMAADHIVNTPIVDPFQ